MTAIKKIKKIINNLKGICCSWINGGGVVGGVTKKGKANATDQTARWIKVVSLFFKSLAFKWTQK